MKSACLRVGLLCVIGFTSLAIAADEKAAPSAMETLKKAVGTWEFDKPGPDGTIKTIEFKSTAMGSVIMETMFPGTQYEMMNAYHADGDAVVMTHYCGQGVQPHMKLASTDGKTLKFDFASCSNLKEGEGCMGALELTIDGDKLIEKWVSRDKDGKPTEEMLFTMHRKA